MAGIRDEPTQLALAVLARGERRLNVTQEFVQRGADATHLRARIGVGGVHSIGDVHVPASEGSARHPLGDGGDSFEGTQTSAHEQRGARDRSEEGDGTDADEDRRERARRRLGVAHRQTGHHGVASDRASRDPERAEVAVEVDRHGAVSGTQGGGERGHLLVGQGDLGAVAARVSGRQGLPVAADHRLERPDTWGGSRRLRRVGPRSLRFLGRRAHAPRDGRGTNASELKRCGDLLVQPVVHERPQRGDRRQTHHDDGDGDQAARPDDEDALQSLWSAGHEALIVYPTPRTVWMSGSRPASIFRRRYEM